MAVPVTTKTGLLDLIKQCGVIERERLAAFLEAHPFLDDDAAELAQVLVDEGLLTPFQSKHLLAGRKRGLVLGQYRVLEPIGKGGTALVYLARHRKMQRKVAIKVLPPHRAHDREALERFYREARAVAALDHPTIVKAHDVAREGGIHYLVMEYVEGQSLKDCLEKRGPMPVREAARYIIQTLAGLQHAHERGIIHRDIKPANLLLDKSGNIKILDMGLVKFFQEDDDTLTRDLSKGAVLGTADYLSPEQALACHDVDIRSDIYSLGATFYTLLAGQPPFHGSKLTQKLIDHQIKDPPPLHERRPDVPPELCALVRKMMAKKPEDRFQTPAAVQKALAPWLRDKPPAPPVVAPKADPLPFVPPAQAAAPSLTAKLLNAWQSWQSWMSQQSWKQLMPWLAAGAVLVVGLAGVLWAWK
jgi:serine/threonine protein kinase